MFLRTLRNSLIFFFTYESDLPDGVGFSQYGPAHLLWLAGIAVFIFIYLRAFRRLDPGRQRRAALRIAWGPFALEALRLLVLWRLGHLTVYELPLHLCGLACFLCPLDTLSRRKWVGEVVYTLCLPGTLAALLFPDWVRYPALSFISIQGFLFHGLIILYVFCQLSRGALQPSVRRFWQPVAFLWAVGLPMYWFNKAINANYLFINWPSAGSPLEDLAAVMGNPGYLVGYGAVVFAVILLMYLPPAAVGAVRKKRAEGTK